MATKRRILTLEDKVKIIRQIESGTKKSEVCRKLNLVCSTVHTIWRNRNKYIKAYESNGARIKRLRKPERSDVDEALLKWYHEQKNTHILINGPVLMKKAEELAKQLKHDHFVCSNGWIDRFKNRHNIFFGKTNVESNVNNEVAQKWLSTVWCNVREGYTDRNVFNIDETDILFSGGLKYKDEKNICSKISKEQITVLICTNVDGSEKRKIFVLSNSKSSKCIKYVTNLTIHYSGNKKTSMTSEFFVSEIKTWDQELADENRKILLLITNCPVHPALSNLNNIKLVFLPTNLHPMSQGVVRSLKLHYRKLLLLKMEESVEKKQDYSITLMDVITCITKAWKRVSIKTIRTSFSLAGISTNKEIINWTESIPMFGSSCENLPLSVLLEENHSDTLNFEQYSTNIKDEDETENELTLTEVEQVPAPSVIEALEAIRVVNMFYEARGASSEILTHIMNIEQNLENIFWLNRKQQNKIL